MHVHINLKMRSTRQIIRGYIEDWRASATHSEYETLRKNPVLKLDGNRCIAFRGLGKIVR